LASGEIIAFCGRVTDAGPPQDLEGPRNIGARRALGEIAFCTQRRQFFATATLINWFSATPSVSASLRAAANSWLGHDAEARAAIAGLLKLKPGLTMQQVTSIKFSDDPQFQREAQRMFEGLRKAGLPEGEAKMN
jgi:hypothetical protein